MASAGFEDGVSILGSFVLEFDIALRGTTTLGFALDNTARPPNFAPIKDEIPIAANTMKQYDVSTMFI
jgi:hypothetical protein